MLGTLVQDHNRLPPGRYPVRRGAAILPDSGGMAAGGAFRLQDPARIQTGTYQPGRVTDEERPEHRRNRRPYPPGLRGVERPGLGGAGNLLWRSEIRRRTCGRAGAAGVPGDHGRRRHADGDAGRGRGRGAGDRHSRRIRRPAGAEPAGWRRRVAAGEGRRQRPWLRPQPAWCRFDARRHHVEAMAGGKRRAGPDPLLRLSGRRGRRRQGLHGPRRPVRRCRCRLLLASEQLLRSDSAPIRWPMRGWISTSAAPPATPRRPRIWGAARWMRSS